jgi:hypothetical protein
MAKETELSAELQESVNKLNDTINKMKDLNLPRINVKFNQHLYFGQQKTPPYQRRRFALFFSFYISYEKGFCDYEGKHIRIGIAILCWSLSIMIWPKMICGYLKNKFNGKRDTIHT